MVLRFNYATKKSVENTVSVLSPHRIDYSKVGYSESPMAELIEGLLPCKKDVA